MLAHLLRRGRSLHRLRRPRQAGARPAARRRSRRAARRVSCARPTRWDGAPFNVGGGRDAQPLAARDRPSFCRELTGREVEVAESDRDPPGRRADLPLGLLGAVTRTPTGGRSGPPRQIAERHLRAGSRAATARWTRSNAAVTTCRRRSSPAPGGSIGSESVAALRRGTASTSSGIENDMRAHFFGPDGLDRAATTERLVDALPTAFRPIDARHPRRRRRRLRLFAEHARRARARRPHRGAAVARLGGLGPADGLRGQRQRDAEPARGDAAARARRDVRLHARRTRSTATAPNELPLVELETRLELPDDHAYYGGHRHVDVDRPSHALALRRLEGRRRPARPGVRALLRHADRLLPRRLPHRPEPRRRPAARLPLLPDALHGHRRAATRSSATTASRCATTSTAPTSCGAFAAFHRRPARGRRLQHRRRPRAATARCSRRSRSASRSPAASSTGARRRAADRRPPLVDQRPRRVPPRLPRLGARATTSTTIAARDPRRERRALGGARREALGRHPGPQRGGVDRRDGAARSRPPRSSGGDRLRDGRRRRRAARDGTAARRRRARRAEPARPLHPLATTARGFGFAVRAGLDVFEGDAVAIVMADGSDDPGDLVRYHRLLEEGYDCAFGSRFVARRAGRRLPAPQARASTGSSTSASACSSGTATTTRRTRSRPTGAR